MCITAAKSYYIITKMEQRPEFGTAEFAESKRPRKDTECPPVWKTQLIEYGRAILVVVHYALVRARSSRSLVYTNIRP